MSVDLHPTAIGRFRQNLEQISAAGDQIDPHVAASFRELVDSVVVMARKPGEPYRLETRGRLASLISGSSSPAGATKAVSARMVVPVERIELPTFGLQNHASVAAYECFQAVSCSNRCSGRRWRAGACYAATRSIRRLTL
jgi:hypothetical protein